MYVIINMYNQYNFPLIFELVKSSLEVDIFKLRLIRFTFTYFYLLIFHIA